MVLQMLTTEVELKLPASRSVLHVEDTVYNWAEEAKPFPRRGGGEAAQILIETSETSL